MKRARVWTARRIKLFLLIQRFGRRARGEQTRNDHHARASKQSGSNLHGVMDSERPIMRHVHIRAACLHTFGLGVRVVRMTQHAGRAAPASAAAQALRSVVISALL